MTRIGEIILIQPEHVMIECYPDSDIKPGMLVCTEQSTHWGIMSEMMSVCIEEGKASQAFGDSDSNDAKLQNKFPHLQNSLRTLAKIHLWEIKPSFISINQGVYSGTFSVSVFDNPEYWRTLEKIPLPTLRKNIRWLQGADPLFDLEMYIQKLSKYSRPLAWNLYLQDIEN